MITTIALKEFHSNLISSRFIFGFLLCLFLVPFSLFVSIGDYKSQVRAYEVDRKAAEKENSSIRVYSALRPFLVKPPEPLSIFSRGISYNVGSKIQVLLGEKPFMTTGKSLDRENPFLNSFLSIDFISIIAVVMSLIAILFTYNICSREREMGTLKLTLSNSISRWKILLGKALGVFLTLLPIILFCYILCAVIILVSPRISFSFEEWTRVVLLCAISIVYIMIFMLMGMFISTRTRSSATSIVLCLFAWVVFVFIIPNLSVYAAQSLIQVESQDNLRTGLAELDKEFEGKVEAYQKKIGMDPMQNIGSSGEYDDGHLELGGQSPEYMEFQRRLCQYSEPLRIEYADRKWAVQKEFLDRLDLQRRRAETLSLVSPSELFRLIASSLCRTDVKSHERFLETVGRYRETIISFLKDKNLFASYVYFTRQKPETFMPTAVFLSKLSGGKAKTLQEFIALVSAPGFDPSTFGKVDIPGADPFKHPPLDISNVPRFQWEPLSLGGELRKIMIKLAAMILAGIVLFYLSFVSFTRYDVR
jgi:ABC-type transport system involved in multi-copper enzyme maturation permease subunit